MQLLEKTANEKLKNIAIPALGTGTLQFPRDTVAKIMVQCVEIFGKAAATKNSLKKVSFVAFDLDKPMIQAFENALKNVNGAGADGSTNDVNTDSGNIRRAAASTHSLIDLDDKDIHHAVGPMWPTSTRAIGEIELKHKKKYSKETLGEAMKNILKKAEEEECRVLAVPAISSGIYGFPKDICAKILIKSTSEMLAKSSFQHLKEIHFINNDKPTVQVFYDEFVTSFGMRPTFEKVHDIREPQVNASNSVRMRTDSVKKLAGRQSQRETKTKVGGQGNATDTVVSAGNGLEIELVIGDLAKVEVSLFIFCFCLVNAFR